MHAIAARTNAAARRRGERAESESRSITCQGPSPARFTRRSSSSAPRRLRGLRAPTVPRLCASSKHAVCTSIDGARTAEVGDVVSIHWACLDERGATIETSRTSGEPATFEVGAGDIVGNELFEAFDEAVRGLSVGETIGIKADGPAWTEELMFNVPIDHPEIERMNGRYKNQGGCHEGLLAELSNGGMAVVVKVDEGAGMVVLDANSMMAGKSMLFELELLDIVRDEGI
jgi:FKBP-type peptidyl-prolyl cis-trans isomerase 2